MRSSILILFILGSLTPVESFSSTLSLVSSSAKGDPATGVLPNGFYSAGTESSDDGRYVVFLDQAPNLFPDGWKDCPIALKKDTLTGELSSVGTYIPGHYCAGIYGMISGDGLTGFFQSEDNHLLPGTSTGATIRSYVHDFITGKVQEILLGPDHDSSLELILKGASSDGQYILVNESSIGTGYFWMNRKTNEVRPVSFGNKIIQFAAISADGQTVVGNTLDENTEPSKQEILTMNMSNGQITAIVGADSSSNNSMLFYDAKISGEGRYVSFLSATPLTQSDCAPYSNGGQYQTYVKDTLTGELKLYTGTLDRSCKHSTTWNNTISNDGKWIAFELCDFQTSPAVGKIERVNTQTGEISEIWPGVEHDGISTCGNVTPQLSGDGQSVTFDSYSELIPGITGRQTYKVSF